MRKAKTANKARTAVRSADQNFLSLEAAEQSTHQRFADLRANLARDRTRDLFDHDFARGHAARITAAENTAENPADHATDTAALLLLRLGRGGGCLLLQYLVGGHAIDRRVIFTLHGACSDYGFPLGIGHRTYAAGRRADQRLLHHFGHAVSLQEGNQRLALPEFGDDALGVELRVRPEGLGRSLHAFLFGRRIGAERMLDAVAELGEHGFGDVDRVLRHEIDADAFRADQPHDLLDLLQEHLRSE